jgi:hypothetical protein
MTDIVERLLAGTGGGKHWMELHEKAAAEIASLRSQLADMERERDVSRGNAAMHMEAARNLAVQLEAAQAKAELYDWIRSAAPEDTRPALMATTCEQFDAAIHKAREQSK